MEHEVGDPLTGATCASCRFWLRNKPRPDRLGWDRTGDCRRHPATVATLGDEWCGDYALRPGLAPIGKDAVAAIDPAAA